MERLDAFLERFRKYTVPHKEGRERCVVHCKQTLKKDVPLSAVRVSGSVVYIDVHPLLKGELQLHKQALLDALNADLPEGKPQYTDIR